MTRSCKKTHKRVSGVCVPNNVVNKSLYARIKKKISRRVKRKGGKYRGRKRTFGSKKRKSKRRRKSRKSRKRRRSRRRRTRRRR